MITVVDVYDVAAAIGKDFEVIIDRFGVDAVSQLMPKVISVLEELEDMAIRQEQETHEISSLKSAVARLEAEKLARALDRTRYEKVSVEWFRIDLSSLYSTVTYGQIYFSCIQFTVIRVHKLCNEFYYDC